jgi:hypothetical protein
MSNMYPAVRNKAVNILMPFLAMYFTWTEYFVYLFFFTNSNKLFTQFIIWAFYWQYTNSACLLYIKIKDVQMAYTPLKPPGDCCVSPDSCPHIYLKQISEL